jgi:putative ABC transport system permease protein
MRRLADLWHRAIALVQADRRSLEDGLDDEIRFHVEQQTEKNRRAGLSPGEARRQALVRFGGVEQTRERTREHLRVALVDTLARDVSYGLRSLRRHPAFTAMAVLSLAIGIGANTAIFGVVRALLFGKSPLVHPETLVNIYETDNGHGFNPLSYPDIDDLRRDTTGVFSGIAASTFVVPPIDLGDATGIVMGEAVNGGAFALLGIEPQLGRAILPEDDIARGGRPVVMLSDGYWRRAFAADPLVVGRTLRMAGRSYTVIGVAPAGYRGGLPAVTPAFFVPMAMADELMGIEMRTQRDFHNHFVKARLAPGVSRVQAEQAVSLVAQQLTRARPQGWAPGRGFSLVPTSDVQIVPGVDPILRASAFLLMAVVGLVLLLACTNLASFLLARALDRSREVAVRRALGASRGALVRQWLVESALVGVAGSAAGLVLATSLLSVLLSVDLPLPYGMRLDVHLGLGVSSLLDWRVLALTACVGIVAGGLLGIVPAVQGTRADPGSALTTAGRASEAPAQVRWRSVLVVAQVAMSLVLLVGAGLFLRSWQQTLAVDPGFGHAPTAILSVMLPTRRTTPADFEQRARRLLERFRALPGVAAAGLVWPLPLELSSSYIDVGIDGHVPPAGREAFRAEHTTVDGAFFEAAGIRIVSGRTFNDADRRDGLSVAIVSQAMARRYWPDGDALGRILHMKSRGQADLTVVGVASDINVRSLGETPRDVVYQPYTQAIPLPGFSFVVRAAADPARLSLTLGAAGRELDPDLRIMQSTTMSEHLAYSRLPAQLGAFLLSAFAVLALALSSVGVYGMVRYSVARRTREVGIRMALGADAAGVARLLATNGVRLVIIGGVIGIAASLLAARFFASLLFGVDNFDPVALIAAPLVLVAAAWLAAYLPARQASRADPLTSLRTE